MNFQLIWFVFLSFGLYQTFGQIFKKVELETHYQCPDAFDYLLDFTNTNGGFESTVLYLQGNFTIKEEILEPVKLTVYAHRCSLTDSNQCESFLNYTIDNLCQNMVNPNLMGYRYLSKFDPPMSCPLKPGVVDVSERDIIFDRLLKLPVEGYRWKLKGMFSGRTSTNEGKQIIGCEIVEFKVVKSTKMEEFALVI